METKFISIRVVDAERDGGEGYTRTSTLAQQGTTLQFLGVMPHACTFEPRTVVDAEALRDYAIHCIRNLTRPPVIIRHDSKGGWAVEVGGVTIGGEKTRWPTVKRAHEWADMQGYSPITVVMSADEFRFEVNEAYADGFNDGEKRATQK